MRTYIDGSVRLACDWCFARTPPSPSRDIPIKPEGWEVAMVVHSADRVEHRAACPQHVRQLDVWEQTGLERVR